jgi:hypothetical protein
LKIVKYLKINTKKTVKTATATIKYPVKASFHFINGYTVFPNLVVEI